MSGKGARFCVWVLRISDQVGADHAFGMWACTAHSKVTLAAAKVLFIQRKFWGPGAAQLAALGRHTWPAFFKAWGDPG